MTLTLSTAAAIAAFLGLGPAHPPEPTGPQITPAGSHTFDFGDNTGEYVDDGECDDPRFVGEGMASTVDDENIGRDRKDCASHFERGNIRWAMGQDNFDVSQCAAIEFGLDTSEYARDDECDDPRFDGPGTDSIMQINDLRGDATDCKALCEAGQIWLK